MNDEPLDTRLDELRRNIVNGVIWEPEDRRELLLAPRTRMARSDGNDYKCFTLWNGPTAIIRMGGATWPVLSTFIRTAATYFVRDETGALPSKEWPAARNKLASTIDWFAVGAEKPRIAPISLSPRQWLPARAFTAFAYRFIICHELSHVALGHGDTFARLQHRQDIELLRGLQQNEDSADRFGLRLQIQSLVNPSDEVTALSAPLYFILMLRAFQDFRLALLAELVDEHGWVIELTHPPYLGRAFSILGGASDVAGDNAVEGLKSVLDSLQELIGKVWEAGYKQRDNTASKVSALLHARRPDPGTLSALLIASPTGLLMALDRDSDRSWEDPAWPYANILPPELLEILRLDRKARAAAIV